MGRPVRHFSFDVVVVGGGIGGCSAALTAQHHGLSATLIVKGFLGRSSCSVLAAYINRPPYGDGARTGKSAELERELVARHHQHYLVDAEYARESASYIHRRFFDEIEDMGLYFLRHEDGRLVSNDAPVPQMAAHKYGHTARMTSDLLRKQVLSRPIDLHEETMVTGLLQAADGRCIGVLAYDYRNDAYLAVRARTTIIATGHTNYLATRSTGTRDMTGNGFAMAYRAGADIQNLEMQLWHIGDISSPPSWMRFHNYPNPLLGTNERVVMVNSVGEPFFSGNDYPIVTAPYYIQMRQLAREVEAGRARWDGGYYADYRHIPQDVLERYHTMPATFRKLGKELSRDMIESAVTWHMTAGGLRVDAKTMATSVPGLLTAGSVGGHYLGDIPHCYYDGWVASSHAADELGKMPRQDEVEVAVAREMERIEGIEDAVPRNPLSPSQVKRQIREIVSEHLGYIKTRRSLEHALEQLERARWELLPRLTVRRRPGTWNYSLVDALDAVDMLDAAWLSARFSLYREESRGPFYRADFPETDHEHWLCDVVGTLQDGDVRLTRHPIRSPLSEPPQKREDFFEYR